MLEYVKKVEKKVRFLIISFNAFSFLYLVMGNIFSKYNFRIEMNNILFVLGTAALSMIMGYVIQKEIEDFFQDDWDWKPKNKFERLQNEFICLIGIGVLYYLFFLGIMILFFPSFEMIAINSVKLYRLLFAGVSVAIYAIYRLTIIKF